MNARSDKHKAQPGKEAADIKAVRRNRWALLARVTRPVVDSVSLVEQMRTLTGEVRAAFGVDACVIRALDGEWAVLLAADGLRKELLVPKLPTNQGIAREIIQSQKPLFVADITDNPAAATSLLQSDGQTYLYRSYAGAPLLLNDRVVGMLGIYHVHKKHEFTARDLEHLQIVANHAAVALENDRLFRALREKTEQLEAQMAEAKRLEAEREILLADAVERARRDPLTGLFNHHVFYQRVGAEVQKVRARLSDINEADASPLPSFAIVLLDVDHFKFFNEAYGHAAGDRVLQTVAEGLRDFCGPNDIAARVGGDEFGLLLPRRTVGEVQEIADRLRERVPRTGYYPPGAMAPIPVRISVGVAALPGESKTQNGVVHLADERLRQSKTGGGTAGPVQSAWAASSGIGTRDLLNAPEARKQYAARFEGFALLNALLEAVDDKDRYSINHCDEVAQYCGLLARELKLGDADADILQMAALLHDVGKIGVSDLILRFPAALDADAQKNMERHTRLGHLLAAAAPDMAHLAPLLRAHHERWDGGGYPDGLKGEEIPPLARILAVADGFAAMTSDRPYRTRFSPEAAFAELRRGAGSQWDAQFVDALLRVYATHANPSK